MDIARLNRRFDWLWTRLENLVEAHLRHHNSPGDTTEPDNAPDLPPIRDLYFTAQTLKRIYDGRRAALNGDKNDLQPQRPSRSTQDAARRLSQRIHTMHRQNGESHHA